MHEQIALLPLSLTALFDHVAGAEWGGKSFIYLSLLGYTVGMYGSIG